MAANAASAGLKSYVLIPADLEQGKVLGSLVYGTNVVGIHGPYDQVNRLCSEIAGKYGWGFVNVNLRPYYAEGSKTMGFEICEQLGWRIADDTVSAASRILTFFGIGDLAARSMQTLSGGQQQLVLLAQRLLREPQLLLLDEATSALDVRHQMHVLKLLRDYVNRTGALVLIAVHDLNLAARHSETVMLLNGGQLVGHGAFDKVITPDILRFVYGIEAEFIPTRSGIPVILPLSPTSAETNPMEETP